MTNTCQTDRSIVRAVAWTAAAKWTAQILSWLSTIVVARLLTPSDYGLVGMTGLYTALATLITQTGIADAVIALRDLTRRQIAELNTVAVLVGLALVGISCAMAQPLAAFFHTPALRAVVLVVSVSYLINGFQVVPQALLQKELRFKLLAGIETLRSFAQIAVTLVLAWLGFGYWSLIYGTIIAGAVATALMLVWRRHEFAFPDFSQLRRELSFSGNVMISGIGWYAYSESDFLVAGRMLGPAPLGDYTVAWTISSAPIEKISTLVTNVTPAYFAAIQHNKAELRRYLLRLTEALSYVTVPASLGIALVADYLVPVLLGPKWIGVIGPLRILGLLMAFRSVAILPSRVLTAVRDTDFAMRMTIVTAIAMPLAFLVGSRWGTNGIAAAWIIVYPPITLPLFYRTFRKIDMTAKEYLSSMMPSLNASITMTVVVMLVRYVLPGGWSLLACCAVLVVIGAASYVGALFAFHRKRLMQLFRAMRGVETAETAIASAQVQ